MRIVELVATEVRWPMAPRQAARGRDERAALIVEVATSSGHGARSPRTRGFGEAAPLPGVSPDTLDDARCALELLARRVPFAVADDVRAIARFVATVSSSAATRCAL